MTGRDRPKSRAITIYLIKSNYTAPEDIFTIGERSRHDFFIEGLPATLYLRKSQEKIPNWTSLFESYIDFEGLDLESFSTSAILLLEVSNRIFALTFGYGRFFLKPWVWEENFGLKVSLNSIDPAKLRIIDHKTLDTIAFHTREQSSRDASLSDFDLDTQQDLIKAVTGIPSEEILGTRMTGVDSLTTNVKMNLNDVPALLESYLEKFRENTYRSTFPNIDYISEVRDVSVIEELDNSLIQKIQEGNLEKVWAAVPDLIDWTDNSGFKVSVLEENIDDIYLHVLLEKIGAHSFSTEFLKKNYVARLDSIGFKKERWPLYKCLYGEVDYNGRNYILNNGKWYALEQGFVAQVDAAIGQIGESNVTLPPYQDAS